jgi:hypothetical protein
MLHAPQDDEKQPDARVARDHLLAGNHGQADEGVQLVDSSVSFNARRIFLHALASGEAGFSRVAAFCVDAVQGKVRVIERSFRHVIIFAHLSVCPLPYGRGSAEPPCVSMRTDENRAVA